MTEYVEKEEAIKAIANDLPEQVRYSREDAGDCIRYMDAADVAPVRHGRWVPVDEEEDAFDCSECNAMVRRRHNFCPNCGAKMDGGGVDAGQPQFCSNPNCTEVTVGDDCTKNDVSGHREIHDHGQRTDQ